MKTVIVILLVIIGAVQAYGAKVRKAVATNAPLDESDGEFQIEADGMVGQADEGEVHTKAGFATAGTVHENSPTAVEFEENDRTGFTTLGSLDDERVWDGFNVRSAVIYQAILKNPYLQVEN